jgi:hypothetical protein
MCLALILLAKVLLKTCLRLIKFSIYEDKLCFLQLFKLLVNDWCQAHSVVTWKLHGNYQK